MPGLLSQLSIPDSWFLAQVTIPGLWGWAPHRVPRWVWSLLGILSLSLSASPVLARSLTRWLSGKKKKIKVNSLVLFFFFEETEKYNLAIFKSIIFFKTRAKIPISQEIEFLSHYVNELLMLGFVIKWHCWIMRLGGNVKSDNARLHVWRP